MIEQQMHFTDDLIIVHRDIPGEHSTGLSWCWCQPNAFPADDPRTDDEIADALNRWDRGH